MLLKIKDASFSYKRGIKIIDKLNFEADRGDLIAILGPNGSGKTTMLRCIMGFLKFNEGTSCFCGKNIYKIPSKKLWNKISYVPQAKGFISSMLVSDMILLGLASKIGVFSTPSDKDYKKVTEIAKYLQIDYLLDKKCNQISGGELQMVLVARAIISEPELLILDEPESNLDFRNQLIVLDTLSALASKGMCVIFNTHYPEHALTRANKSLILSKGGNTVFGDTEKIVTEENIRNAFGVSAIISEVETKGNIYKSIMPLKITTDITEKNLFDGNRDAIAVISVIFSDYSLSGKINSMFSDFSKYIIGRMGMPYSKGGVYIINVTVDAPLSSIDSLRHNLSILPGVNVKATISDKCDEVTEW